VRLVQGFAKNLQFSAKTAAFYPKKAELRALWNRRCDESFRRTKRTLLARQLAARSGRHLQPQRGCG